MKTRILAAGFLVAIVLTAQALSDEVAQPAPVAPSPTQTPGAAKPLPPLDCWRCMGPAACGPCRPHHPGFLYYGTWPWDDDPANGFNDCPGGNCGGLGRGLSLLWIRCHPGRLLPCLDRQPGDIGSYQDPR